MNLIVCKSDPNADKGGKGSKNPKILQSSLMEAPKVISRSPRRKIAIDTVAATATAPKRTAASSSHAPFSHPPKQRTGTEDGRADGERLRNGDDGGVVGSAALEGRGGENSCWFGTLVSVNAFPVSHQLNEVGKEREVALAVS